MEIKDYFKGCRIIMQKGTYVIIKSKRPYSEAFANIMDGKEITVVIDQSKYNEEDVVEIEKGWRILTFDVVLPSDLVGFLAEISRILAEEGVPIFVVSSYSTDHILVKERDVTKARRRLESLGCISVVT